MRHSRGDVVCAVALGAATAVYIAAWPHDFQGFDEGMYLYEAKRVLDGDVMYRDFFQILTPVWFYLMAGCYALFGVSMETARATVIVLHGAIVATIFLVGRRLALPLAFAALLAFVHPTLGYPAQSITTPHWFSTWLCLLLAAAILRSPVSRSRAAAWGLLIGTLILVQQQKGVIMAMGVGLIVLIDARATLPSWREVAACAGSYVLAIGALVVPVMLTFVALAGFENVWNALVRYPLEHYPRVHQNVPWGFYVDGVVPLGFIVQWLPIVIPLAAVAVALRSLRGGSDGRRAVLVLLVLSLFGLTSVLYNRNYFHFALVAPLWFLLAGSLWPYLLGRVWRSSALVRGAVQVTAGILIVLCVVQLIATVQTRRAALSFPSQTVFGRIDTYDERQPQLMQQLYTLLHSQPGAEMFVFPANPGLYLIMGMRNPTRYQIALPGYTAEPEANEIIDALERQRVEFVIRHLYPGAGLDSLNRYIHEKYKLETRIGGNVVYRRIPSTPPGATF